MKEPRDRKTAKKNRDLSGREYKFRLNPLRQMAFVGIALAGIGIGYGLGYLSKDKSPSSGPSGPVAAGKPAAPDRLPLQVPLAPLLPEKSNGEMGKPVRPYEEALPKDIIETGKEKLGLDFTVTPPPTMLRAPTPEPGPLKLKPEPKVAALTSKPEPAIENRPRIAPRIAIVIDDLGIDKPRTARTIRLKGPLTLSFMTYATGLGKQTEAAQSAGHELWMHIPMEPGSADVDPGPNVLLTGIPEKELLTSLKWNLAQFSGYVGINNHMGSRFTADLTGMTLVMKELKKRNLLFLDSVTSGKTVGRRAAKSIGVPFIVRNVFLDHEDDIVAIQKRLKEVERLARKVGIAVAIGHPREATLRALIPWLEKIESRGFRLVPLSVAVKKN